MVGCEGGILVVHAAVGDTWYCLRFSSSVSQSYSSVGSYSLDYVNGDYIRIVISITINVNTDILGTSYL